ncbi:TonB family protein [Shewanella sp.]|uniref:TonB family protein n=1 Tax=Shewanella sp. TaxID=50422 RepID=UPI001ED31E81|nr:TonB family protein [Shewanella sp.]NRB25052.1 TonB family protein [Shewanella sp.]
MNTIFKMKSTFITLILILLTCGCAIQSKNTAEKDINSPINNNAERDTKASPVKRYPPSYPSEAARQGIEGWVQLMFDIDKQGYTKNINVIKSKPVGTFEQSAIDSLKRWEYQPKVVHGEAIYQQEQTIQLDFTLDKNEVFNPSSSTRHSYSPRPANKYQKITDIDVYNGVKQGFELYTEGKLKQALETATNIQATTPFEQAYVDRIIGNFYAELGRMEQAIYYLNEASKVQLLTDVSHGATTRLLADLNYHQGHYQAALDSYHDWINFTGNQDPRVLARITSAALKLRRN